MSTTGFTRAGAQRLIERFIKMEILEAKSKEAIYDIKYIYKDYYKAFDS